MKKRFDESAWLRWFAGRNEALMFTLAVVYLACLAFLVVFWVDVPGLQERARELVERNEVDPSALANTAIASKPPATLERGVLILMGVIWLVMVGEAIGHWLTRPWHATARRYHWYSLYVCVCPALRMGARSMEMHDRIWLPKLGWRQAGQRLKRQLERHLSVPMMVIALMIMPILIIEFFLKDQVAAYGWLRNLLHIGTGVIWFAFAAEFIIMISVAEKKFHYCKQHWVDLAIILLPLISFLRTLSLARMMRLTHLMRVQQLTKLARAYRLRGTALKAFRVLVLFDLLERVLQTSNAKRIEKLEKKLVELDNEGRMLRQEIAKLKRLEQERLAAEQEMAEIDDGLANDSKESLPSSRSGCA